jgi:FHA domain
MSGNFETDFLDDDPTDELPVLSEALLREQAAAAALVAPEEAPAAPSPEMQQATSVEAPRPDPAELCSRVAELERELAEQTTALAARELEIERQRQELVREREDSQKVKAAAAQHKAQLDEQGTTLAAEQERTAALLKQLAAAEAEIERVVAQREQTTAEIQTQQPPQRDHELQRYREEIATLGHYIAMRNELSRQLTETLAARDMRLKEVGAELAQRMQRELQAEERAGREALRAGSLLEKLTAAEAALKEQSAQLREERLARSSSATHPEKTPNDTSERSLDHPPRLATLLQPEGDHSLAEVAELRVQRTQLAQALVDRETELEELRLQHEKLQQSLANAARWLGLANTGAESSEAGAAPGRDAPAHSGSATAADAPRSRRSASRRRRNQESSVLTPWPASNSAVATFHCLTSDQPTSYELKPATTMTIGRGSHCGVQISTHYVSREHARLMVGPKHVTLEDLGSKNGVFVNAVRVQTHQLKHGDLVTIGETQFRFVSP